MKNNTEKKLTNIELSKEYCDEAGKVKVISFIEKNYLVAKRKGCMPFIIRLSKFANRFKECK